MKHFPSLSCSRTFLSFAMVLAAFLLVGVMPAAADEAPAAPAVPVKAELEAPVDDLGLPTVAFKTASIDGCRCTRRTVSATRVGATCLRARQRAAAAARDLAVCPVDEPHCDSTTHTVAPCQPIPNGYSATATATYYCEVCDDTGGGPGDPV